jgi:hypothetical protein
MVGTGWNRFRLVGWFGSGTIKPSVDSYKNKNKTKKVPGVRLVWFGVVRVSSFFRLNVCS